MSPETRARYKQLANDSIIETFGTECPEQRLAQALETCVEELEDANDKCPVCSTCKNHGDHVDESLHVDVAEIIRIHGELKKQLKAFKDYHVELTAKLAEWADTERFTEPLAEIIEETQGFVDELEAEVLP